MTACVWIGALACLANLACDTAAQTDAPTGAAPQASTQTSYKVEVVAEGLEIPWGIAFAPDGRIFVTERPGRVRVIEKGRLLSQPLLVLSDLRTGGECGLMDITLDPDFSRNGWVYLTYVSESSNEVRVARFTERDGKLVDERLVLGGITAGMFHAGCRARFGPDKKLYVTTGELFEGDRAQDMNDLCGKTLRINPDGSVPTDNPFFGQSGKRAEIWSFGHRNSQGIAWHPETGMMVQTEHGPSGGDAPGGGDEVNVVERGKNYGWPIIHHKMTQAGLESPALEYTPAVAPAGATFCTGKRFPGWKNHFFFACLRGERIIRVQFDGKKAVAQEDLFKGQYGRIRDVAEGPDGYIYFCTSNRDGRGSPRAADDRIFRIVPAN